VGGSARALLNKLMSLPETDTSKLAEIGFSMGGSFGLELARDGAPLAAVAAFHAGLQTKSPAEPGKVKAKILEQTGADDPLVPFDQIKAFEEEMTRAGADWQLISYSGTKHGFTNPEAAGNPALAYNKTVDASAYDDSMSVPNRRSTRTPPSRKASVMRGIWFGTYRPGGRRSEREQVVVQRLAVRGAAVARAQAAAGDADIAGERGKTSDRSGALPAIAALVHRAAAKDEHRGLRRRIPPRDLGDSLGRDAGDGGAKRFAVTRWRSEVNSNCRYRFLNCRTTASC